MANDMPALAWMLTNRVRPSGLNVDPANSSPVRSTPVLLVSAFFAMLNSWPRRVRPRRKLKSLWSSQTTSVPRGLVVTLSGKSRTSGPGDW
jgi:hypothetical protein